MFVKIITEPKKGKTTTLYNISKSYNSNKTVWISRYVEELSVCDKITYDIESNLSLSTLMTKYLALGYKNFFIDDTALFE